MLIKKSLAIRNNYRNRNPRPLSIAANITGRCNLKCYFCEKGSDKSQNHEIDFNHLKKLIDLGIEFDCPILFAGGEPFLHPRIWDVLDYCASRNKKISIVTNGTQLYNIDAYKDNILSRSISSFTVSLDSAIPSMHDKMRGVAGSYDKVMQFLNKPNRKIKIGLSTLLFPGMSNMYPLIDIAHTKNCSISFQPLIFESNFPSMSVSDWKKDIKKHLAFSRHDMQLLRSYSKYADKLKVSTNLSMILKFIYAYFNKADSNDYFMDHAIRKFTCFIPFQQLTVADNGDICPCIFMEGENSIYSGNIYESWEEISIKYRKLLQGGKRFDVCKSCSHLFPENLRSNMIVHPIINLDKLPWFLFYYIKRSMQGDGRKQ